METWAHVWKIVFILGVAVFAVMSVWVTIAGFKDLKRLLARLRRKRKRGR